MSDFRPDDRSPCFHASQLAHSRWPRNLTSAFETMRSSVSNNSPSRAIHGCSSMTACGVRPDLRGITLQSIRVTGVPKTLPCTNGIFSNGSSINDALSFGRNGFRCRRGIMRPSCVISQTPSILFSSAPGIHHSAGFTSPFFSIIILPKFRRSEPVYTAVPAEASGSQLQPEVEWRPGGTYPLLL